MDQDDMQAQPLQRNGNAVCLNALQTKLRLTQSLYNHEDFTS